jgi:hypothetical protein
MYYLIYYTTVPRGVPQEAAKSIVVAQQQQTIFAGTLYLLLTHVTAAAVAPQDAAKSIVIAQQQQIASLSLPMPIG